MLRDEFKRWEELLAGISEEQIIAKQLPDTLSIKDVIAHLWAWQQRSIARMEAGLHDREPDYPNWPAEFDPEPEGEPDQLNAWIYETNLEKLWSQVYGDWKSGFLSFLELAEAIPENNLFEIGRYIWLEKYPLSAVLLGSYEHHEEHLEDLQEWLREYGG